MHKVFSSTHSKKQNEVAIVIHGLNLKPSAMNPFIAELNAKGIDVVRLTLTGHGDEPKPLETVTADIWINDLKNCYRFTKENYPNSAIQGVGFSLGAGVLLSALAHARDSSKDKHELFQFSKLTLLAPAICTTLKVTLGRIVFLPGLARLCVPSVAPASIRAHSKLPAQAYRAMFQIIDSAFQCKKEVLIKQTGSISILMSCNDILVSAAKVKAWADKRQISFIDLGEFESDKKYQHLLVCREIVGERIWKELLRNF